LPKDKLIGFVRSDTLRRLQKEFLDPSYIINGFGATGEGTSVLTIASGQARSNWYKIWRETSTTFNVGDADEGGSGSLTASSTRYVWLDQNDKIHFTSTESDPGTNSVEIAKVVIGSTNITTITDKRDTTSISVSLGMILDDIIDVSISSVSDNDLLQYNSSSGKWENTKIIEAITSITTPSINPEADNDLKLFENAVSGENPTLYIYGYDSNVSSSLKYGYLYVNPWGIFKISAQYMVSIGDGTSKLKLMSDASGDITVFADCTSGENRHVYIYGYDTGESAKKWGDLYVNGNGNFFVDSAPGQVIHIGPSSGKIELLYNADGNIYAFTNCASGENRSFYIYGYDTAAGAKKYGQMYVDGNGTFTLHSEETLNITSGYDVYIGTAGSRYIFFDAGGTFQFRDRDATYTVRAEISSSTGKASFGGSVDANYYVKAYGDMYADAIYLNDGGFKKQYDVMTIQVVMSEQSSTGTNWSTRGECCIKPLLSHFKYAKAVAFLKSSSSSAYARLRCEAFSNTNAWAASSGYGQTLSTSYVWVESGWLSLTSDHYAVGVQISNGQGTETAYVKHAGVVLSSTNF